MSRKKRLLAYFEKLNGLEKDILVGKAAELLLERNFCIETEDGMDLDVVVEQSSEAVEDEVLKYHATQQEVEEALKRTRKLGEAALSYVEPIPVIKRGCSDRSFFRNISKKEGTKGGEFGKCLREAGIENEKADSIVSAFLYYYWLPPQAEWHIYLKKWVREIYPELMDSYLRAEQEFRQSWKEDDVQDAQIIDNKVPILCVKRVTHRGIKIDGIDYWNDKLVMHFLGKRVKVEIGENSISVLDPNRNPICTFEK